MLKKCFTSQALDGLFTPLFMKGEDAILARDNGHGNELVARSLLKNIGGRVAKYKKVSIEK